MADSDNDALIKRTHPECWALMCELKTATGGSTSSLVQVCLTKAGAENLAKRRTQAVGELMDQPIGTSGIKLKSVLRDMGIVGVAHQILGSEMKDPGVIEEVTPRLVLHS